MNILRKTAVPAVLAVPATHALTSPANAAVPGETAFVFNSFMFLVCGALVMFMAAGFSMLESGMVRTKNTAAICLKNIALYSIAGVMFYVIGYSLMYVDVGTFIGSFSLLYNPAAAELALIDAPEPTEELIAAASAPGYASMSDWFFQMVFVATAASIVSGAVAERIKVWPFLIFVIALTGFIYPIQAAWTWGGGWLDQIGFSDFAGSTIVHAVGGWAALTGAIILGPRAGKYDPDGKVSPLPGANLPLAALGTFILWFGWFGFNGGSQLALGSVVDAAEMSIVFVNTNMAAAAGVIAAMLATQAIYGKLDLTMALNGALAGLVSITAGPDVQNHLLAIIVGGIGGVLVVFAIPMLDRLRIDDVVGAISVHLVAGVWGTLAVAVFGDADILVQLVGIVAVGAFVAATSAAAWLIIKHTIGLRVNGDEEQSGLDRIELGLEAYPEFGRGSQTA